MTIEPASSHRNPGSQAAVVPNAGPDHVGFMFTVGWATDYTRLFRSEFRTLTDAAVILRPTLDNGRTIIASKGGSGKTTIARRLLTAALLGGVASVFVDMKRWSPVHQEVWDGIAPDRLASADFLLARLADTNTSLANLDALPPETPKLVIIDGLNEVRPNVAQRILEAADRLAASYVCLSVVITDRLLRRELDLNRWALATILPLRESVVRQALEGSVGSTAWEQATPRQRQLLESPFFLDKTIKDGRLTASNSEAIDTYLREHAGLTAPEVAAAAEAAYAAYRRGRGGRTFLFPPFAKTAGLETTERLTSAGVLVQEGSSTYFQHHLFHDFLAASYLASNPGDWDDAALDAISFGAGSFDAVSKVLEQLPVEAADLFVRKIYDWNPYAAAYAISDAGLSAQTKVSPEMMVVIEAMLAERRWDLVEATAQRSSDALEVLGTVEARRLLEAHGLQEVIEFVQSIASQQRWFLDWQGLFTRPQGDPACAEDITQLQSADSVLGWTAANVLRRMSVTEEQLRRIGEIARCATLSGAIRWRAVHVMGAFPSHHSRTVLLSSLDNDHYEWARYGALRSLMEIAARAQGLRPVIFDDLLARIDFLFSRPSLLEEFSRAALASVSGDTQLWDTGMGRMLRALLERARNAQDVERWARLGQELEARHAA